MVIVFHAGYYASAWNPYYNSEGIHGDAVMRSIFVDEKVVKYKTEVLEINDAEWAAGIWNGTVGAEFEIFDSAVSVKSIADAVKV